MFARNRASDPSSLARRVALRAQKARAQKERLVHSVTAHGIHRVLRPEGSDRRSITAPTTAQPRQLRSALRCAQSEHRHHLSRSLRGAPLSSAAAERGSRPSSALRWPAAACAAFPPGKAVEERRLRFSVRALRHALHARARGADHLERLLFGRGRAACSFLTSAWAWSMSVSGAPASLARLARA